MIKRITNYLLLALSYLSVNNSNAQDWIHGDFSCWNNCFQQFSSSAGNSRIKYYTGNKAGNYYFRLNHSFSDYTVVSGKDSSIDATTPYSLVKASSGSMVINVPSDTSYVYLKTPAANDNKLIYFITEGIVSEISSVNRNSYLVYPNTDISISAKLNNAAPVGQGVYLRFTTDNWSNSVIRPMSADTNGIYKAIIEDSFNNKSDTIHYYVFSSGDSLNITHKDADWYTLNLQNNNGKNYTYIVQPRGLSRVADTFTFDESPDFDKNNFSYTYKFGNNRKNKLRISPNSKNIKSEHLKNGYLEGAKGGCLSFLGADTSFSAILFELEYPISIRSLHFSDIDSMKSGNWRAYSTNKNADTINWTTDKFYYKDTNDEYSGFDLSMNNWNIVNEFIIEWNGSVSALDTSIFSAILDNLVYEDVGFITPKDVIICENQQNSISIPFSYFVNIPDTSSIQIKSSDSSWIPAKNIAFSSKNQYTDGLFYDTLKISSVNKSGSSKISLMLKYGNETVTSTFSINCLSPEIGDTTLIQTCSEYKWKGQTLIKEGIYADTLQSQFGCDSIVFIQLEFQNDYVVISDSSCSDYTWGSQKITKTGVYIDTLTNRYGCDSVVELNLIIFANPVTNLNVQACQSFNWNGVLYKQSGNYSDTFLSQRGCDSIVNLKLSIQSVLQTVDTIHACTEYIWNSKKITATGLYIDTLTSIQNCDSIAQHWIVIHQPSFTTVKTSSCNNYKWRNTTITSSGKYYDTLINVWGCDSVVELDLTLNKSVTQTVAVSSCEFWDWKGTTVTQSGDYADTLTSFTGCDSIRIYQVNITKPSFLKIEEQSCGAFNWNGKTFNVSGKYIDTFKNFRGCDSIVELNLTVTDVDTSVTISGTTLMAKSVSGSFQWLDCKMDYAKMEGETKNYFVPQKNGEYAVEVTENGCVDTSNCISVNSLNVSYIESGIKIYPNPSNGQIFIDCESCSNDLIELRLYDFVGKEVYRNNLKVSSHDETILLPVNSGIYTIQLISNGQVVEKNLFIKN